jgi:hypothetical protein
MLSTEQALAVAGPRQRRALVEADAFATAMGSPVRFICRRRPEGAEFEAVMVGSARTCATVSARGELSWLAGRRPREAWTGAGAAGPPARSVAPPPEPATVIASVARVEREEAATRPVPAPARAGVRLRTGRWHLTLVGPDGHPIASLALSRR